MEYWLALLKPSEAPLEIQPSKRKGPQLQSMHSVSSEDTDAMYVPDVYTQLYTIKAPSPIYTTHMLLLIGLFVLVLPLLAVGLGQSLLPDLARGLLVEFGKEQIEHFRVPADGVAFDTMLDVL